MYHSVLYVIPPGFTAEYHDLRHLQKRKEVLFVLRHWELVALLLTKESGVSTQWLSHPHDTHKHLLICRAGLSSLEVCDELFGK